MKAVPGLPNWRALSEAGLLRLVALEVPRARERVLNLRHAWPREEARALAQRLIDAKKALAQTSGGVTGVFGVLAIPADLVFVSWLQVSLLVDLALLFGKNLKGEDARRELLDLFGSVNGIGPLGRASPQVLGKLATFALERGGLTTLGRALPLVASPLSAYLNGQHLQKVGEEALRHYTGFDKARARRSRPDPQ